MKKLFKLAVAKGNENNKKINLCIIAMISSIFLLILLYAIQNGAVSLMEHIQKTGGDVTVNNLDKTIRDWNLVFVFLHSISIVILVTSFVNLFAIILSSKIKQKDWISMLMVMGYTKKDILIIEALQMWYQTFWGILVGGIGGMAGSVVVDLVLKKSYEQITTLTGGVFLADSLFVIPFLLGCALVCIGIGIIPTAIIMKEGKGYITVG